MFGFQRASPAAVMVREMPSDQTPHVMITQRHTWPRILVYWCNKYFPGASWPIATGGTICGCGNDDEYSLVGISDVSGRVPTRVMGVKCSGRFCSTRAHTANGHMSLCQLLELPCPYVIRDKICHIVYSQWTMQSS